MAALNAHTHAYRRMLNAAVHGLSFSRRPRTRVGGYMLSSALLVEEGKVNQSPSGVKYIPIQK